MRPALELAILVHVCKDGRRNEKRRRQVQKSALRVSVLSGTEALLPSHAYKVLHTVAIDDNLFGIHNSWASMLTQRRKAHLHRTGLAGRKRSRYDLLDGAIANLRLGERALTRWTEVRLLVAEPLEAPVAKEVAFVALEHSPQRDLEAYGAEDRIVGSLHGERILGFQASRLPGFRPTKLGA
jgi:hypothetical protein